MINALKIVSNFIRSVFDYFAGINNVYLSKLNINMLLEFVYN